MSDAPVSAPAASEPEAVALPTPISVEPRVAPAEAAEVARQAEEAKLPKSEKAAEPAKAKTDEPVKPRSTKEALRAAREKIEAEAASPIKSEPKTVEPAAKAAEPVPAKADNAKTADAKAEPTVARGEDGKFVSTKAPAAETADKGEPVKAATTAEPAKEPAKPSFTAEPPPKRFAKAAQERWAEAPEEVRAEVQRMERELTQGFEKHRAAAQRDSELADFHAMAEKGGTTVKEALSRYTNMESTLRNPATRDQGIEAIFANIGISPREWATKLLGQTPDVAATKADATIAELRNELAELKKGLGEIHAERTQVKTDSTTKAVTEFAAAHPRFDELSEDIAFFLKTRCPGDLAKAYELAERLNPALAAKEPEPVKAAVAAEVPAAPIAKPTLVAPAPVANTAGQKSIAGAPTAGSDPTRKQPSSSIKEALKRARQAVA